MTGDKSITNPENFTLPYEVTADNIIMLFDAIKVKEGNEEGIKKIYGGAKFDSTRKALEIVGILENGLNFSQSGRALAFESEEGKRKDMFLDTIMKFPPYEYLLRNISNTGFPNETDLNYIKNYWGKHNFGNSPNNRDSAATVFGYFVELAGLGELKLGRKGKSTRIIWDSNADSRLRETLDMNSTVVNELNSDFDTNKNTNEISINTDSQIESIEQQNEISVSHNTHISQSVKYNPKIVINVDMSLWDIDKIQAFFKAAYGDFDSNEN